VNDLTLPRAHTKLDDLVLLTKIRLNALVVATTAGGYYMAAPAAIDPASLVTTCMGTALVASGAAAINQVMERDLDRLMNRTKERPIADGRTAAERVESVVTFTGQSLSVPPGATPVLRMDDKAYDWESDAVRHSARGHAQGVAFEFGKGRVVMLGEAGLLSAQVDPLGFKMGMSSTVGNDKQFALNLFHWLSGALK